MVLTCKLFSFCNYAYARVINVNECPVPLDFTISDFCVLSTLGMWFAIPIIISRNAGFRFDQTILGNIFSR